MRNPTRAQCVMAAIALMVTGCTSGMTEAWSTTQLLSVSPPGGAANISGVPDVTLRFDQSMMPGMEQFLVLHRGGLTGPTVPMNCSWSDGQKTLICRPVQPLDSASAYTIHIGGGMMDADGQRVAMGSNGMRMGGSLAMGGMMGDQTAMMGAGWRDAAGSYGMSFGFTTQ